jgi:hypothetical protein
MKGAAKLETATTQERGGGFTFIIFLDVGKFTSLNATSRQKIVPFIIFLRSRGHYIFQEIGEKSVETVEIS